MKKLLFTLLFILTFSLPSLCLSADYFDWATRTDRDDKPAGVFTTTPFPVVDGDSTYAITNDEGTTTYNLGTIVYVDNSGCGACADYSPINRDCGGAHADSDETNYATIAAAIAAQATGNKTILVRAGTYTETNLMPPAGTDDTHRYHIIGYNQERPVINGASTTEDTFKFDTNVAYVTLQRLKIQDNYRNGILGRATNSYINVIDVELQNNNKWHDVNGQTYADANLYFLGSANSWVHHCTAHRTTVHNFKIGDNADDCIIEWSVAYEAGYWVGFDSDKVENKGVNLDFPNDAGVFQTGLICRYNIAYTSMSAGVQIRRCQGFSFHHNEIYDSPHFGEKAGAQAVSHGPMMVVIHSGDQSAGWGDFYSNILRDSGTAETDTPSCFNVYMNDPSSTQNLNIYNNLFYIADDDAELIDISSSNNSNLTVNYYNNSHYCSTAGTILDVNNDDDTDVKNNVFYQAGSGSCATYLAGTVNDYNRYYHPSGSEGDNADGANDDEATAPEWTSNPSGAWAAGEAEADAQMAGTNTVQAILTTDKDGTVRGTYTQGWDEYSSEADTTPPVIQNIDPLPTEEYPSATTEVTVTWDTNECAVCRIGEADEADEDDLTYLATVETQGACGDGYGTSFSYDSTGLSPEDAKTYYIGGEDESEGNETTANAISAFTIAALPPPGGRMTLAFP